MHKSWKALAVLCIAWLFVGGCEKKEPIHDVEQNTISE
jgi:hypothetical protein